MSGPRIIYTPAYEVDLKNHIFPTSKYRLIKEKLISCYGFSESDFTTPQEVVYDDIAETHSPQYVEKIRGRAISFSDELRMEIPFSIELANAALISCGGTLSACNSALKSYASAHLGGGFHHAYPDHGEGFCVFNDVAFAAKKMANKGLKILIIDADVHQGNGTAHFFRDDPRIFTFSIHQENNYPLNKEISDMDVSVADGTAGPEYNKKLRESLKYIKSEFKADLIIYLAGADAYCDDMLGGLNLSDEDLLIRDEIVKEFSIKTAPAALVLAGGYSPEIENTVKIHASSVALFLN